MPISIVVTDPAEPVGKKSQEFDDPIVLNNFYLVGLLEIGVPVSEIPLELMKMTPMAVL